MEAGRRAGLGEGAGAASAPGNEIPGARGPCGIASPGEGETLRGRPGSFVAFCSCLGTCVDALFGCSAVCMLFVFIFSSVVLGVGGLRAATLGGVGERTAFPRWPPRPVS